MTKSSNSIDKFLNSSISLAFLTLTSFSVAYCYCWGQAVFHGYPWWHVEIENSVIARSLAYVLGASFVLFVSYATGLAFINKIFKKCYFNHIGWLRVMVFTSAFTMPVVCTFYIFIGFVPLFLVVIYAIITAICIALFHKKLDSLSLKFDFATLIDANFWSLTVFIFAYFSIIAFGIGYVRSDLRVTYDYIYVDNKPYYILTTNGDHGYIMAKDIKDNCEFIFFNRESQKYYTVHVAKIRQY